MQVEVTTVAEALEAVDTGARFVMCDNMPVDVLRETVAAVRATGEQVEIEATGGLTLDVARDYARTGDRLPVGGRPDAFLPGPRHRARTSWAEAGGHGSPVTGLPCLLGTLWG